MNPLVSYLLAVIAGALIIRTFRLLTSAATVVAALMALLLLFAGGWIWVMPPLAFLISSSIWTRWPGASRSSDHTRNARQVLANSLPALFFSALALMKTQPHYAIAIVGCCAAAAADTWATEWGGRFGGRPLSLRSFRFVTSGQSGAITLLGTIASLTGALFISASAAVVDMIDWNVVLMIGIAGTLGSIADSLAGAWLQAAWKTRRGEFSETPPGGRKIKPERGFRWVDNDIVNVIATTTGAILSILWYVD